MNLQKKSVSLWYLCHIRVIANCFQLIRTLHYFVVCVFINTEEGYTATEHWSITDQWPSMSIVCTGLHWISSCTSSVSVVVDLYSASLRTSLWCDTASRKSALRFPVQPSTSTTLRDHGTVVFPYSYWYTCDSVTKHITAVIFVSFEGWVKWSVFI